MRPETRIEWPNGEPFYAGKTVYTPEYRLYRHRLDAVKKPHGKVSSRVIECGQFIRVKTMEVVSADQDWCAREKFWIFTGRLLYPGSFVNVADGGAGSAGWVPSEETREKFRVMNIGRKHTYEVRERCSAAAKLAWKSTDHRANIVTKLTGRKKSPEHLAKIAVALTGKKLSAETRAKLSAANTGKKLSAETRAKMGASRLGKKRPPEVAAKIWATRRHNKWTREATAPMAVLQPNGNADADS